MCVVVAGLLCRLIYSTGLHIKIGQMHPQRTTYIGTLTDRTAGAFTQF